MNLTNIWKACGSVGFKRPAEWLRHDDTVQLIESFDKTLKYGSGGYLKSVTAVMGRYGGTYAHWQIGLSYARVAEP